MNDATDLATRLAALRPRLEAALDHLMPAAAAVPATVHEAMRYSLLGGGKRLRPALAAFAFEAAGGTGDGFLPVACAIEMVHTYSLIHDDLPAMDDDDLRRGRPTCHKVYGEAIAILAGDGLLTRAFEVLATEVPEAGTARRLVRELAVAAGSEGMVGGQVLDLGAEGGAPDPALVRTLAERKTAALIRASLRMGAIAAGAPSPLIDRLGEYGGLVGLAFQVVDDILDLLSTAEELGKTPGKDQKHAKLTFPSVGGVEGARELAARLIEEAKASLADLSGCAPLRALADHVLHRRS